MVYLIVCAAAVIADVFVKQWIVLNVPPGTVRPFIPGLISITHVNNFGAAFSILQNMRWLFVLATCLFIAAAVWAYITKKVTYPLGVWALTGIMAGAVGNCIDRLRFGYVVDMFNFDFINFAVFNVADVFICLGTFVFCVYLLFFYEKKEAIRPRADGDKDEKAER